MDTRENTRFRSRTSYAVEAHSWRKERKWQLQSARLFLAAAKARDANPASAWLPCLPPELLRARASEAVRRARLAHLEFLATRRLERDSVAGRIAALATDKTIARGERA